MPGNVHKGSHFLADYAAIVTDLCEVNPEAAERALALLENHPHAGSKAGFRHAPEVRKWVVQPFRNYLLFYEVRAEEVVPVRLLHGARDLPTLIPPS